MFRIKKNDTVMLTSGKDKGKTGKVLRLILERSSATVEGANLVKKNIRRTQENPQGGILQIERPIHLSNLMPYCKNCNRAVRIGFSLSKEGEKYRVCKQCKQAI